MLSLFFVSILYECTFYYTAYVFFSSLKKFRSMVILWYSIFLTLVFILVYGHFFYFGTLPNNFSINYVIDHYPDAYALTSASLHWYHFLIFLALTVGMYSIFQKSAAMIPSIPKKITYSVVVLFTAMTITLSNNVRFHPDSYSFTPNTLFAFKYVIQERYFNSKFEIRRGYVKRMFSIKGQKEIRPKYNCLVIVGESVRGLNMRFHGYPRTTTPFLDSMISMGKVIPFKNHISNCVSTQYAVPMILSGNFTLEKLHQPYVYDYVNRWTTAKTFFISSQSMVISNIHLVYETLLDTFICQERTTLPQFNDMGVNDQDLVKIVDSYIGGLESEKFFGIIQFNNTHYPYSISDKRYEQFVPAQHLSMNSYDNTLLEQDDLIKKYFSILSDKKLLDSTVVIYVADHGEAFNEHNHSGHLQSLYQEDISTPMWVYLPPTFPQELSRRLIEKQTINTSHLDLFPTMLDILGIKDSSKLNIIPAGISLFDPISKGRTIPLIGMDMIDTKGVVIDTVKYIVTLRQNRIQGEVYDLKNDPEELVNLWTMISPERKKYFESKLAETERLRHSYKTGLRQ